MSVLLKRPRRGIASITSPVSGKTDREIIDALLGSGVKFPLDRKITRRGEDERSGYLQGYQAAKNYVKWMLDGEPEQADSEGDGR